jgi:nicotinamidase-related amidase
MLEIADPATTAVVLVEFQNIWTRPGVYHSLIAREVSRRDPVGHAVALTRAARAAGAAVVHAPLVVDPANKRGLFAHVSMGLVFRKGTPAAEIDARVYAATDLVAHGRTAFDAFVGSDLEALLRERNLRTLLFGGFATDQCVGKTMATARTRGFEGWLVTDACATFAGPLHRRAERRFPGRVVTAAEAAAAVRGAGKRHGVAAVTA